MSPETYARIRHELGLTQQELAQLLGVCIMTISRRERGTNPIETEAVRALRDVRRELQALDR